MSEARMTGSRREPIHHDRNRRRIVPRQLKAKSTAEKNKPVRRVPAPELNRDNIKAPGTGWKSCRPCRTAGPVAMATCGHVADWAEATP
jgi:hypothetical protein